MKLRISNKIIILCVFLVFTTSVIIGALVLYQYNLNLNETLIDRKKDEINILKSHIDARISELKNDTKFLSSTPPIMGIIRAYENDGIDPRDKSTIKQWEDRFGILATQMLYAKETYIQARYIMASGEGMEIVRAERDDEDIIIVPKNKLQSKKNEPYFKGVLGLEKNDVYLSKFEPNREYGKIVLPVQMVVRAAVPIYRDEKNKFGFVIINMDYQGVFESMKEFIHYGDEFFVADMDDKILLHSDSEVSGEKHIDKDLENVGSHLKKINYIEKSKGEIWVGISNSKLIMRKDIYYDSENSDNYVSVYLVTDREKIKSQVMKEILLNLFIVLFLVHLSALCAWYFSRFISVPLEKLIDFSSKLGKDSINDLDLHTSDEIGVLGKKLSEMNQEIINKNLALAQQKQALDSAALVIEVDKEGHVLYVNDLYAKTMMINKEEISSLSLNDIRFSYESGGEFNLFNITSTSTFEIQTDIINQILWFSVTVYPFLDNIESIEKYIVILIDITDKKNNQIRLIEETERALAAAKMKSMFLANMSHEIRTPLNGIIGLTQLININQLDEDSKNNIKDIKASSQSLLTIVNDILDLSKLESGKIEVCKSCSSLSALLEGVTATLRQLAVSKELDLRINIHHQMSSDYYFLDSERLRQILLNLVGNAIKFTNMGYVEICVEQVVDGQLKFTVKDTGIGISEDVIPKLFNSFEQGDSSTTKIYGGTGLGLSISSKLLQLMSGKIWIESELGVGSHFIFTLNSNTCTPRDNVKDVVEVESRSKNRELRILMAEDNLINQKVGLGFLQRLGQKNVKLAGNGEIALNMAREATYDLILMDVQMPVMDGLEATRLIRKEVGDDVLIVGVSANAFATDRENALKAGMNDYLEKPLSFDKLKGVIDKIIKG